MNTNMTTTARHIFLIFFLIFLVTSCSTTQQGRTGSGDTDRKNEPQRPLVFHDRH